MILLRLTSCLLFFATSTLIHGFFYNSELMRIPQEAMEPYRLRHQLTNSFKSLFQRAEDAYSKLDFERAEQVYNTLLLINSRDLVSLDRLSQVYLMQARFKEAASLAKRCLEIDPFYSPALHQLAKVYLYLGEFKKSVRYAKTLIESGRAYEQTYLVLLHALYSLSQMDNAIAVANLAREAKSPHPQFQFFPLLIKALKLNPLEARDLLKPFFLKNGSHSKIHLYQYIQARCFLDPNAAKKILTRIGNKSFPSPVHAYLFLSLAMKEIGTIANRDDLLKDAVELSKLAISVRPTFILPYRILLELLSRENHYQGILSFASKGLTAAPSFRYFLEKQGEAAFFLKENLLAVKALKRAVELESRDPDLMGYLAILQTLDGESMEEGFQTADIALTIEPENPYAQTALGLYYLSRNEPLRAKIPFGQAIRKPLPITLPYEKLIQILRRSGEWRTAYEVAKKARIIHRDESLHIHVTEIAFHLNQFSECAQFSRESARLFPNQPAFPLTASKSYRALEKYNEALRALDPLKPGPGATEEVNVLYLQLLLSRNLYFETQEVLKSLLALNPRNSAYKGIEATFLYEKGEYREALGAFQALVKLTGNKKWLSQVGWIKYLLKQKSNAIKDLDMASIRGDKKDRALAFYRLGLIYSLTGGKKSESTANYTRAFELIPRLQEAHDDHVLVLDLNQSSKDRGIIRRNMELYLK